MAVQQVIGYLEADYLCPGRSVNSCKANYSLLLGFPRGSVSGPGQHPPITGAAEQSPLQNKRPSLGQGQVAGQRGGFNPPTQGQVGTPGSVNYGQPPTGDLPLQARPSAPDPSMHPQFSHFAAVNEPPPTPGAYQTGRDAPAYASDKKGKKRGRPSKAEIEIRAAQALARGEPWPPLKKTKTPRTSVEGAPGPGEGEAGPGSKNKPGRKPKAKSGPVAASGEGQMPAAQAAGTVSGEETQSPEDEAQGADPMQVDVAEGHTKSTIPETQASEFAAPESLLAGMREQAGQSAQAVEAKENAEIPQTAPTQPETVQSSVTVKQDPTPQNQPRSTMSQA